MNAPATTPEAARERLLALMADLRGSLCTHFAAAAQGSPAGSEWLQDGLPLQLELSCKLEEQVLLPALAERLPAEDFGLRRAGREIGLLRDLALLGEGLDGAQHELLAGALQGLALLHFDGTDGLLRAPAAQQLPWAELHAEVRAWLERWRTELQADGDIEDEERDPVGLPPR